MSTNGYYGVRPQYNNTLINSPLGFKGKPVSSLEEAKSAIVDFDGVINYFPDFNNNKIYTKQFNPNGTVVFKIFSYEEEVPKEENNVEYVTKEEVEQIIQKMMKPTAKPEMNIEF